MEDSFAVAAVLDEKQKITSYVPVSHPVGKWWTQNVAPDRTPMHLPMCVEPAVYKHSSCARYSYVSNLFGNLKKKKIMFHKSMLKRQTKHLNVDAKKEGAYKIARRFEAVHLISRFMALIDGTNILPPWHGYMNFESRKGWPSFVLQAVVNNELARHFITSWLFRQFEFHSTYAVSNQLKGSGASH